MRLVKLTLCSLPLVCSRLRMFPPIDRRTCHSASSTLANDVFISFETVYAGRDGPSSHMGSELCSCAESRFVMICDCDPAMLLTKRGRKMFEENMFPVIEPDKYCMLMISPKMTNRSRECESKLKSFQKKEKYFCT